MASNTVTETYTATIALIKEFEDAVAEMEATEIPKALCALVDKITVESQAVLREGNGDWVPLEKALTMWHAYDYYEFDAFDEVIYAMKTLHD